MLLLEQMLILFLLMLVGYTARRVGIINDAGSKVVSGIVVNIANPALILSASMNTESTIQGAELLGTLGLAIAINLIMIIIGKAVAALLCKNPADRGSYELMMVFSNIGFMGFPLLSSMYGSESLLYASLFIIPFNVLIYTYGIRTMEVASGKEEAYAGKRDIRALLKKVFNVGVIACILTMIIYMLRIPIPKFIQSTVSHLSGLTAPLSMIVIGDSMAGMNLKKLVGDVRMLIFSAIKLLVVPIVGVILLKVFNVEPMLAGVVMVMIATPAASMTAMLAQQYDANYDLASRGVAITTLLSVMTMPVVSLVLSM